MYILSLLFLFCDIFAFAVSSDWHRNLRGDLLTLDCSNFLLGDDLDCDYVFKVLESDTNLLCNCGFQENSLNFTCNLNEPKICKIETFCKECTNVKALDDPTSKGKADRNCSSSSFGGQSNPLSHSTLRVLEVSFGITIYLIILYYTWKYYKKKYVDLSPKKETSMLVLLLKGTEVVNEEGNIVGFWKYMLKECECKNQCCCCCANSNVPRSHQISICLVSHLLSLTLSIGFASVAEAANTTSCREADGSWSYEYDMTLPWARGINYPTGFIPVMFIVPLLLFLLKKISDIVKGTKDQSTFNYICYFTGISFLSFMIIYRNHFDASWDWTVYVSVYLFSRIFYWIFGANLINLSKYILGRTLLCYFSSKGENDQINFFEDDYETKLIEKPSLNS